MTSEELLALAAKVKDNTATDEERESFFAALQAKIAEVAATAAKL